MASLVLECAADKVLPDRSNVTGWLELGRSMPADAVRVSGDAFIADVTADNLNSMISSGGLDDEWACALSTLQQKMFSVH